MTTLEADAFEEIFLKLEEESERRALETEDPLLSPNIPDLAVAAQRAARPKHRHRGSVSISRFGHIEDPTQQLETTLSPSQLPPAFVRGMTTFPPFYGVQSHNHSADSLSEESSFGDDAGRSAESEHVTQVHRIAGRQRLSCTVGGILQRTLARSRSKNCFSSSVINTNVVIGVVVEEDHKEEPEPRETPPRQAMAYVQAPSTLRPQPSRTTIPRAGTRDVSGSWRRKAGELFKRKTGLRRNTLWTLTSTRES